MSHSSLPSRQSREPSQKAATGTHTNWPSTGVAHRASLPQHLKSFSPEDKPSGHSLPSPVVRNEQRKAAIRTHVGVLVGSVSGPAVGVAVAAPAARDAQAAARAAELPRATRVIPGCGNYCSHDNRHTATNYSLGAFTYCNRARPRRRRSVCARRSATRPQCSARRPRTPTRLRRTRPLRPPPWRSPPQRPRPAHLRTIYVQLTGYK